MANIFLDTNRLVSFIEQRGEQVDLNFEEEDIFISPLSVHILLYITKKRLPQPIIRESINLFTCVEFNEAICMKAFHGPTDDFEDNVQLHCAAEAECDYYLTDDKRLLNMKFFGKTRIVSDLSHK